MLHKNGMEPQVLTSRQKAAVIVRSMLAEGSDIQLRALSPAAQAALAQEIAVMGMIDKATRDAVITEFCDKLEAVGLSFPGSIDGALALLDGHLSEATTDGLRRMAALSGVTDPWQRIGSLPTQTLAELSRTEAVEVAAVMLSNLPTPRAAEVFQIIDPVLARQIAFAMSLTSTIEKATLRRIGLALAQAADALPKPAIGGGPVEKLGAILNSSQSATRDSVLEGLDSDDADFASDVRKTIFTWAHIPERIDPRDISRIMREVDGPVMTRALAGAKGINAPTVDFIFSAISSRLADSMRDDIETMGKVSGKDADQAMSEVVAAIRRMEDEGELVLRSTTPEEEEDTDQPGSAAEDSAPAVTSAPEPPP